MTLSLGMIVRNEGRTLERCLSSVAPFVDEIVIGLAGESTDDTEEIARKYTDKVHKVEWTNHFAEARNKIMARCTGDWYMWLDGDDELKGGEDIRKFMETASPDQALYMGYDYGRSAEGVNTCFLYRERVVWKDAWTWDGRVHEALKRTDTVPVAGVLSSESIVVHHREHKQQDDRNLELLHKELEETEPNPSTRLLMYLGNELAARGRFQEAMLHWRRFMSIAKWNEETYQVAHKIADTYRAMGDFDRSALADFEAIRIQPDWPDAYFGLAQTAYDRGEWNSCVEWIRSGETKEPPKTSLIINPTDYTFTPLVLLGLACVQLGSWDEALENFKRAYAIQPDAELQRNIFGLEEEVAAGKIVQLFLKLREILGRNDEWLKVRKLFEVVPKLIESHPEVRGAWMRTAQQTAHVDNPKIMEDFYVNNPGWVPMSDENILDPNWKSYPRLAFALDVAKSIKSESVLDLGSSDGFISLPMAQEGYNVVGMDLDKRCVELANARAKKWNLPAVYLQGNLSDLSLFAKHDLALFYEVLEHVSDPAATLAEVEKVASHIAITTPFLAWERGQIPEWDKVEPKGHIRIFDLADIERLLGPRGRIHNLYREPWNGTGWIFADYEVGGHTDKNITIVAPPSLEKWGPRKLKNEGLGGSEIAAIRLAEGFARLGHLPTVYNRIDEPGYYSGVRYRESEAFIPDVHSDLLIAWRYPELADTRNATERLVLWMHDTDLGERLTPARADRFDAIVVLTEWHKLHLTQVYPWLDVGKIYVIGNGIDVARFGTPDVQRHPQRVFYSSSPDRGLDVILEHIWPRVTEVVPEAELHIYYGWDSFDAAAKLHPHLRDFKQRIGELLLSNRNVVSHGRLTQPELALAMQEASIWLYPTYFQETFCITAVEAQLAGTYPITNRLAGLAETVKTGIHIDGDVRDPAVAKLYAEAVIATLKNPPNETTRAVIKKEALAKSWLEIASEWRNNFLKESDGRVLRKRRRNNAHEPNRNVSETDSDLGGLDGFKVLEFPGV